MEMILAQAFHGAGRRGSAAIQAPATGG